MSGTNPFRRRADQSAFKATAPAVDSAFSERTEPRVPAIDTDVPRTSRTKVSKTVRIISPHSTTSDDEHGEVRSPFPPARDITSPPPSNPTYTEDLEDDYSNDPFSAGSDGTAGSFEDDGTRQNTLINSKDSQSGRQRAFGVPANPFEKTLASLSIERKPSLSSSVNQNYPQDVETATVRPQYDVDGFKRLLLTGEKSVLATNATPAPPVSFQGPQYAGDSSSNTDASSISRQSIFEPTTGPVQESPSTSHESSPLDDEHKQRVGLQSSSSQKSKPSTPKHRHGKLVRASIPQTVSFEDPSLSFSTSNVTPGLPETPNDIDKPLPSLPQTLEAQDGSNLHAETVKPDPYSESTSMDTGAAPQRRNVPLPPLSRRHSQLKPKPFTSSESSSRTVEEDSNTFTPPSQSPPNTAPKAPPPPPPRRTGGLARMNSSSSTSTSASISLSQSQTSVDEITSNPVKARPPAPPSRSPTISSVKRQQTQAYSGSPAVPPPPPPRRRGSSQSSYTPSRLSGDYRIAANERLRSDSGGSSISHLQMTSTTPTPSSTDNKDVMADLSALQREVDELRGKFRD